MFVTILIKRQLKTFVWAHMHIDWHYLDVKLQGSNIKFANGSRQHHLSLHMTIIALPLLLSIKSLKRHQQASGKMATFCHSLSDFLSCWCNFWNWLKSFSRGSKQCIRMLKFMYNIHAIKFCVKRLTVTDQHVCLTNVYSLILMPWVLIPHTASQ